MRRLPPLNSLKAFEAAARHLSFKRAAEELFVTPTAISHQIRQLEDICGQQLFLRRPRPLRLTNAGHTLFPILRDGFDDFAVAVDRVTVASRNRPLVVSTTTAFASRWLLPRLAAWRSECPDIRLEVRAGEAVADLHADDVDFAVRYAHRPPPNLVSHELFRDRFLPVGNPRLLGTRHRLQPHELADFRLIEFDWKQADPAAPNWARWFEAAGDSGGLEKAETFHVSEEIHAIEAALAGEGVALCSDMLVARELDSGNLVALSDTALPGYGFYAVHLYGMDRATVVTAFARWARNAAV